MRAPLKPTRFLSSHRVTENAYDTQTAQVLDMWQRPLGQRVAQGEAIADIEVVRV